MLAPVEGASIAHELPELYRAVLERVASLEFLGLRAEGLLIRKSAVAIYSRGWDARAMTQMARLRQRAERVLDGHERPRVTGAAGAAAWPWNVARRREGSASDAA